MATVTTIYGDMDDSELLKLEGGFEDDNEITSWVQYHLPKSGELVHRSASVHLKTSPFCEAATAPIG
jgi:hypothetical protein